MLPHRVMMLSLMMMMSGGVMMSGGQVMMLLRRMLRQFRHLKSSPFLVIKRPNHTTRRLSKIKNPFSWPFINSSSDCHKQSRGPSGGMRENQREFRCAFATSYRTSSSR
jgi:hypothetical protein